MTLDEKEFRLFQKWLKGHLSFGPVTITFTKKDGSERVMNCTIKPELIPQELHESNTNNTVDFPIPKKEKKVNRDVMPVYDIEAKSWRSFRWDSITQVRFKL